MWTRSYSKEKPLESEPVGHDRVIIRKGINESVSETGDISYTYVEKVVSETEKDIMEAINEMEIKRENEIIDEYTALLIEEGVL